MVDKTNKKGGTTAKTPLFNPNLRSDESLQEKYQEFLRQGHPPDIAMTGAKTYVSLAAVGHDPDKANIHATLAMALAKPINRTPTIIIM